MKRCLVFAAALFMSIPVMAQEIPTPFDEKWAEIEKQEAEGLLRSMLPTVNEIYDAAKKENNTQQVIRALLYQSKIAVITNDDDDVKRNVVRNFEREIDEAAPVEKAILQSMLAELLYSYYQRNRWTIDQRTRTEEATTDDFRFWSENIFDRNISGHYLTSLENPGSLQNEAITNWEYILEKQDDEDLKPGRELRPTLYDLLAHRAIGFFLNQPQIFFRSFDGTTGAREKKSRAQELLQNLIRFHSEEGNHNARLYNELLLLKSDKSERDNESYISALMALAEADPEAWYTSEVLLELASTYLENVVEEEPEDYSAKKEWNEKALDVIRKIRQTWPETNARGAAENLEEHILAKNFNIRIEEYLLPDRPSPIAITHKNLDRLYVKILGYRPDLDDFFTSPVQELARAKDTDKQRVLNRLLQRYAVVNEFTLNLNSFDDYQDHSTIAKLDPLEPGIYLVLVSNHPGFRVDSDDFTLQSHLANVTGYAIVSNGEEILVTDRESGRPSPGETVTLYTRQGERLLPFDTVTTGADGKALQPVARNRSIQLFYRIDGEDVFYSRYHHQPWRIGEETSRQRTKFMTDRAIYRPGQTLYFKAILYRELPEGEREVVENRNTTVELLDANGRKVSDLSLISNEFGSVSGEFVLPPAGGGLTGQYSLKNEDEAHSFSVEEYRRPRFEVVFDPVEDTYRLDEEIIAKGKATAYSGANIDHASVVYRVYRQAVFPYLPWWQRQIVRPEPPEEIAFGETATDAEGRFEITFRAVPAKERTNSEPRTYTYRIETDVTDINGETRSGGQSITVGDRRLTLSFPVAGRMEWEDFRAIPVSTQNLNGEFVPAQGEVSLIKINPPGRVLRNSPLPAGDYQLYSEEVFTGYFPHEPYNREDQKENWKRDEPVFSTTFDTGESEEIPVTPGEEGQEGHYILKGTLQDGEETIETEQLVYLYRRDRQQPVDNELFSATPDQKSYQPGDTARVLFASSAPESVVFVELEHDGTIVKSEILELGNTARTFSFPIEEAYRGNVYVHYFFGKYNTARHGSLTIPVPYEDKELTITAGTFRDKLQPGGEEVWELTISGTGTDRFLAEVVATMYDASLDLFRSNSIDFSPYRFTRPSTRGSWNIGMGFGIRHFSGLITPAGSRYRATRLVFDRINWFGFSIHGRDRMLLRGTVSVAEQAMAPPPDDEAVEIDIKADLALDAAEQVTVTGYGSEAIGPEDQEGTQVQPRRSLQETAFFFPHLRTDEEGNVKIRFTTPESLTEWKFMALAHTPDLKTANFEARVQTQKELMVVPNPPRFLREGDRIIFSSRITSLADEELSGTAQLRLFDAFTMQPVDTEFGNSSNTRPFTTGPGGGTALSWELNVPDTRQAVVYRVVASAGNYSDGEESALPVLTNRMMVTETLPIHVREGQEKTFTLDKLKEYRSESLDHFKLTLEMTTNPVWYAIFSLPYLREFPHEGSEQIFSRFYGNVISQHLINSTPKIKAVFDDWNRRGELTSRLEQNEELKSILLEETPWVRQAENEAGQMKRIALLFDLNTMRNELTGTFHKLQSRQLPSGGFPWFDGGPENLFITTHIVSGFGHLKAMGIDVEQQLEFDVKDVLENAIRYIDREMEEHYTKTLNHDRMNPSVYRGIQYLYARSYFLEDVPFSDKGNEIAGYYLKEFEKEMFNRALQTQAMMALIFHRFGETSSAKALLRSVKDHAVQSDEMGMYWHSNVSGWHWYQAPIETQALLIEAFDEVPGDTESVESMKVWLLKNRQTNRWHSTKATTNAVYALMSTGKEWVGTGTGAGDGITVNIGGEDLDLQALETAPQSGSGYVKTSWDRDRIRPEMAVAEVQKTSPGVAWGALYWQYFEDLDKITRAETGVRFNKELFLKKLTSGGPELQRITEDTPIRIGDLVTVRLEIQTDRDMEFVHIKDMRAGGFEPVNVLSSYKHRGGPGYYESTRDAATHFFIDRMPRGTYVFEYDLRANNAGNFSNGITSLQNMYAPELSAHSEGIRVDIE